MDYISHVSVSLLRNSNVLNWVYPTHINGRAASTVIPWAGRVLFAFLRFGRGGARRVYSHETRVALVKERVKGMERQRQRRVRSGALILAALAAGTVLGAAVIGPRHRQARGG